ncbi:hypothetical protein [Anaeromyxobacter paludicola]|uniref:Uncharacterized protein n=1 Tax=Anaeromyxobacter paludicola TaxID=2918171 RepID=A0ABM7XFR9_9BACT|nr:hypothetical protein [Anaeromyxobacter paludicola]BDG10743.1 hypothetical protein AMPC_38560 [Anaeromyxobacter paludicola]
MHGRRTARDLETGAAARPAAPAPAAAQGSEPLRMLRRRGLTPRPLRPDLPFDAARPELAAAMADRLRHYAFRLFLRGAILRPGGFAPTEPTRYLAERPARAQAEDLVRLGLAERLDGGRYRLVRPCRTFGGTLEWWLGRELRERLAFEVETGVRLGAPGVGGDLDVVGAAEGRLLYLEAKSSPPKHLTDGEVIAFLARVEAVRPDLALFAMDTALRLADKVVPMFAAALGGAVRPRRLVRQVYALGPHLYLLNAREDLVDNLCRAVAAGFRALAPDLPARAPGPERAAAPGRPAVPEAPGDQAG